MCSSVLRLLVAAVTLQGVISAKFPPNWKRCPKENNEECMKEAIASAIYSLRNGNKALGIIPLDPLHFDKIQFQQGGSSPVTMNMTMTGMDLIGQGHLNVSSAKIDWDKYKMEIDLDYIGNSYVVGDYDIIGKILVLPIQGNGYGNFSFVDAHVKIILTGSEKMVKNKKYFNVEKGEFLLYPKHAHHYMSNLFNGAPKLGETMLKYINENWREIMNEIRPTISVSIGEGIRQIANTFFSKVPVDQIYTN